MRLKREWKWTYAPLPPEPANPWALAGLVLLLLLWPIGLPVGVGALMWLSIKEVQNA